MGRILFIVFIALIVTFMILVESKLLDFAKPKSDDEIHEDFMSEINEIESKRKKK